MTTPLEWRITVKNGNHLESAKRCPSSNAFQLTSSVTLTLEIKGGGAERKQDEEIEYKLIANIQ
jgi:hypothetical protein